MNSPADLGTSTPPGRSTPRNSAGQKQDAPRTERTSFLPALTATASLQKGSFHLEADLALRREVTVLFGPSGAGKSLTLRLLAGFEHPQEGRIVLGDTVLLDTAHRVCVPPGKRRVGMVFQDLALFPHLTALENVAYGIDRDHCGEVRAAAPSGMPQNTFLRALRALREGCRCFGRRLDPKKRERAHFWLSRLGMESFGERFPSELSGGQQQRVALARALAPEPDLLLLDEPFSALDGPVRRNLRRELRKLQRETDVPMLYVTHSVEDVCALGDHMIFLVEGHSAGSLPVERLWDTPLSELHWKALGWGTFLRGELLLSTEGPRFFWEGGSLDITAEALLATTSCTAEARFPHATLDRSGGKKSRAAAVFIAPQDVKLLHDDASVDPLLEANLFEGRIVETVHLGGMFRLSVDAAGTQWQVECPAGSFISGDFEEGHLCRFAVPPHHIAVL